MIIIGLTGGIASGKSTIARVLSRYHIPVFDADKTTHSLMVPKGAALPAILAAFPEAGSQTAGIDRAALGKMVFGQPDKLRQLESILHPLIAHKRERFLQIARRQHAPASVIDVPLLFETGTDMICDTTWLAWAPPHLIQQRALERPHMTEAKLQAIQKNQYSTAEKMKLADAFIATGLGHGHMIRQIHRLLVKAHLRQPRW